MCQAACHCCDLFTDIDMEEEGKDDGMGIINSLMLLILLCTAERFDIFIACAHVSCTIIISWPPSTRQPISF